MTTKAPLARAATDARDDGSSEPAANAVAVEKRRPDCYVVRHAPVSERGVCYGRYAVVLSMSALEAAQHMVERLPHRTNVSIIHSSPLARCAEPAAHVAAALGAKLRIDDRLSELSMGDWEGLRWEHIEREDPARYRAWMDNWQSLAPPGGETTQAFVQRVHDWWQQTEPDDTHLVVAHAGVVRALWVALYGASWEAAMGHPVAHLEPMRLSSFSRMEESRSST